MWKMIDFLEVGLANLVIMSADILNGLWEDGSSKGLLNMAEFVPILQFVQCVGKVGVLTERQSDQGSQEKNFDSRHLLFIDWGWSWFDYYSHDESKQLMQLIEVSVFF